jgi:hypothetical protein
MYRPAGFAPNMAGWTTKAAFQEMRPIGVGPQDAVTPL